MPDGRSELFGDRAARSRLVCESGLGIQPLASPASYAPYVIVVWMVLGVLVLGYFAATDRDRIAATRLVFDEEGAQPDATANGTG